MQTQTGTRSRQKREPRCKALSLVKRVETNHPLFWIPPAINYVIKYEALEKLKFKIYRQKTTDEATKMALSAASMHLEDRVKKTFEYVRSEGLLPLCWVGTRALDEVEVAA